MYSPRSESEGEGEGVERVIYNERMNVRGMYVDVDVVHMDLDIDMYEGMNKAACCVMSVSYRCRVVGMG